MSDQATIINTTAKRGLNLSIRERRFIFKVIAGSSATEAYIAVAMRTDLTPERARAPASRLFKRIREKVDWQRFLEESDLGELRLIRELSRKLTAQKTIFYQGKEVATVEDNGTQMSAVELLADLLGKRKTELDVHHDFVQIVPAPKPDEQPDGGEAP